MKITVVGVVLIIGAILALVVIADACQKRGGNEGKDDEHSSLPS